MPLPCWLSPFPHLRWFQYFIFEISTVLWRPEGEQRRGASASPGDLRRLLIDWCKALWFFWLKAIWYLCLCWSLCHAKICALLYFWQHILLIPFLSSFCKHCCNFCQTIYFFVLLLNLQATTCWVSRAEVRKSRISEPLCWSCVVLLRKSEPLHCSCVGF